MPTSALWRILRSTFGESRPLNVFSKGPIAMFPGKQMELWVGTWETICRFINSQIWLLDDRLDWCWSLRGPGNMWKDGGGSLGDRNQAPRKIEPKKKEHGEWGMSGNWSKNEGRVRGEIFLGGGDSATSNFVWFDKKSEILSGSPEDKKFCPVCWNIRPDSDLAVGVRETALN